MSRGSARELSWSAFDRHVQELARAIRRRFNPDAVIGVAHGGVFVGGALAGALGRDFFPVRITRRSRDAGGQDRSKPRMSGDLPPELSGRTVLIVDDVAATGETLQLAQELAQAVGVKDSATAALVMRPAGFAPDFFAIVTDELVVFPWDYSPLANGAPFEPPRG